MSPLEYNNASVSAQWPVVQKSTVAKCTTNPIRNVVDRLKIPPNPDLPVISLGLGTHPPIIYISIYLFSWVWSNYYLKIFRYRRSNYLREFGNPQGGHRCHHRGLAPSQEPWLSPRHGCIRIQIPASLLISRLRI